MTIVPGVTVTKVALEVVLGVCIKLFCDHGRIHYSDFVNDFFGWLPMVDSDGHDGLTRSIRAKYADAVTDTATEAAASRKAA